MFVVLTVGCALTPLVESCFLAARKASYVLQKSLVYNVLRDMITYSIGNHVATLLLAILSGILPLLILTQMSARSAAHFFIAWMMAAYLFVMPASTSESLFIEVSHPGTYFTTDLVRSLRLGLLLLVPGILFLFFAGPFLLGLFGAEHSTEGLGLLRILAISSFFMAINSTFFSFLKVSKRVNELILLSMISGIGIIVVSYFLLEGFSILGAGIAFLSVQAAISGYVLLRNLGASKRVAKVLIRF